MSAAARAGGERRRVSLVRIVVLCSVVAAMLFAGSRWALAQFGSTDGNRTTVFAPYVDVTLTPELHFEDASEEPAQGVVLGFVVSDPNDGCAPSWGTYYSLDAAARALDLDRRVVRLHERGGEAIVSFGGALNQELAVSCTDGTKLTAAYQSVIDRYQLKTLDFDIEASALTNVAASERRWAAVAALQAKNPGLKVWMTLPVTPQGLTDDGLNEVHRALDAKAKLTGVNVMTMDYGGSRPAGMSMSDANAGALTSTWQQLDGLFRTAGVTLTDQQLWGMLGATPMIGQNDVPDDVFTTGDASALLDVAKRYGLGRLSFWSANRDTPCGASVTDRRVSNTCSGVAQSPLGFTTLFIEGSKEQRTMVPDVSADGDGAQASALMRDDPRTSPYPLWRQAKAYSEGDKVVWQGRVYQAKWFTQGNQPDAPVAHVWDTPWRYLGPVLDSDRQAVTAANAQTSGTLSPWSAEKVFVAGDEVTLDGDVFRAKWWTQGDLPQEDPDQPYDNPWEFLGKAPTGK